MTKLESKKNVLSVSAKQIYEFVENCNNFIKLLPEEKIENWSSTKDSCKFRIKNLSSLSLRVSDKIEYSQVSFIDNGEAPFELKMNFIFEEISANSCQSQVSFEADLNPVLKMMATTPLSNLLNIINDNLKKVEL
ncbi:MAG TPA: hypothetical protein DDX39_03825 [Bacteroidales bacterium]|nr:MAG: hypothetical protein A2W98_08985 [Bacteroidetes bacterium GWF2_33_38]OFY72749.1 MAG: hypothetical protein A2265_01785 [Bacteroidetes bacterium RIFOXYA12_FULL_33_9]OFY90130.1 MAG: hypothetical protein A2236_10145 [Bacteroidetes bacterium RIFOXYA2_FULL_33_7]HBF87750.1 hypothetical protein [Bacteroidales bacterium]